MALRRKRKAADEPQAGPTPNDPLDPSDPIVPDPEPTPPVDPDVPADEPASTEDEPTDKAAERGSRYTTVDTW